MSEGPEMDCFEIINSSKLHVQMVRSAKGRDMLCVDNFLYHYDDRGYKSFRWVCNKRKNKLFPCRARLITNLTDETDESSHAVRKIVDGHTHARCTDAELSKAFERKRLAVLAGEPCTLINKSQKRRQQRQKKIEDIIMQEDEANQKLKEKDLQSDVINYDDKKVDDEPTNNTYLEELLDEWDSDNDLDLEIQVNSVQNTSNMRPKTIYFEKGAIYMLKTPNGGCELLSLDGHLYRCDGRSKVGEVFRWQCIRRRQSCMAYIYTERAKDDSHSLRMLKPMEEHSHKAFTAGRLNAVIADNQLTIIVQPQQTSAVHNTETSEDTMLSTSPPLVKRLAFKPRAVDVDYRYELCENPLEVFNASMKEQQSANGNSKAITKKFTFLPSAKGNKVLCLDNYIYHYDSRSNNNGHAYWTCHLRRHKYYKCNGRIITKLTSDGPRILKVSGFHKHPCDIQDIQDRLYKDVVAQKASDPKMKSSEILDSTMAELGLDFKRVVAKSRESIQRRIERLRCKMFRNNNQQKQNKSQDNILEATTFDSSSCSESVLISEDFYEESLNQPTNKSVDDKFDMMEVSYSDFNIDDIIEEVLDEDDNLEYQTECDQKKEEKEIPTVIEQAVTVKEHADKEPNLIAAKKLQMDITKVRTLRSAKGGELLCVDGYIYHVKSSQKYVCYWTCSKGKDPIIKCPSRLNTISTPNGYEVVKVMNQHTHEVNELDIKIRLSNEIKQSLPDLSEASRELLKHPLHEITEKDSTSRKRRYIASNSDMDMDISQVSILRSAKGGELLCVDGFIYHVKSVQKNRTYWACIKCKDRQFKCPSRVSTVSTLNGLDIVKVTNRHSHPVYVQDIKRRLCNELTKQSPELLNKTKQLLQKPLHELSEDYADLLANERHNRQRRLPQITDIDQLEEIEELEQDVHKMEELGQDVHKMEEREQNVHKMEEISDEEFLDGTEDTIYAYTELIDQPIMKLYGVSDGPPSLAVRMTFKALNLPFDLINVDYAASQHMSDDYAKMNPQKEIPVLDDNGFYLSESIAIMQYLCEKYAPENPLYPADPTARAIVNHRLCFNMGFYYSTIMAHVVAPIFFDYQRTDMTLKKLKNALSVFETYLQRAGTKYAAGDAITIADFALASSTLCLEAVKFDLSEYPLVKAWYETFKYENPQIWSEAEGGMKELEQLELNPPDLSYMNHPFHPSRKSKA